MLLSVLLVLSCHRSGAVSDGNEYRIKAMFLLNFIKYVEWPIENNKPIIRIGVAGESEMFDALTMLAAQRSSEGQKVEIKRVDDKNSGSFQVIFVSNEDYNKTEEKIRKLTGKGVLIVSEDDKCKTRQSGINLFNKDNKIRFEINLTPVKNNGMKISSKLMELASAVHN
ncbi:MAG: YfiR family protein [Bacteroidota bacterium]